MSTYQYYVHLITTKYPICILVSKDIYKFFATVLVRGTAEVKTMTAPIKNLYEILEVSPRASQEVISAAYKALMKQYHPDRAGKGGEEYSLKLNSAKEVLLDPVKREKYDDEIANLGGTIIGNYRVIGEIAKGGFGTTYKGECVTNGKLVCIKHCNKISSQSEQILIEETNAIWDLRHFGIPAMRSLEKLSDGSLALVMSYVPGPTLEQIITKVGRLDSEHVSWMTDRTLNILKYLHYHGVVHGDVKPQNIIIQPEDHTVVLVDYGLSLVKPRADTSNKGYTPFFASPEQMRGETILPESDFYGLGMTMIYALGGDVEKRLVPSDVPVSLCDLIKRFIRFDVLSRPRWENEDLCETIRKIREREYGRTSSNMKPIQGI